MYVRFWKRLFDILVSLVALPFVALTFIIFAPITIHMNHAHHFGISNAYTMYNKTMTESIDKYPLFLFFEIFGLFAQIRADYLL